jgi:hypothetical protein
MDDADMMEMEGVESSLIPSEDEEVWTQKERRLFRAKRQPGFCTSSTAGYNRLNQKRYILTYFSSNLFSDFPWM